MITRAEAERREAGYRQSGLSYLFDLDFFEKFNDNMNCGMEKPLEALEIAGDPETPEEAESPAGQQATPLQKKRRRPNYFGGPRKRRTKGPPTARTGKGKQIKEEAGDLSEYEEVKDFKVKQEEVLFGTEEVGESSRAAPSQSAEQNSEVWAGYNLERSTSTTPVEYTLQSYSLDSKDMGNVTRFSNHSCDPNLDIYSVVTGSQEIFTLALFANRYIEAGSELTFSYSGNTGLERAKEMKKQLKRKGAKGSDDTELFRCKCGTRKCVGYYWN